MIPRKDVYAVIDGERDYQDSKWNPVEDHQHNLTEWLVYIRDYTEEALRVLSRKPDSEAIPFAKHTVRKIAAMGVVCMEQNGALARAQEGHRPVGARADT